MERQRTHHPAGAGGRESKTSQTTNNSCMRLAVHTYYKQKSAKPEARFAKHKTLPSRFRVKLGLRTTKSHVRRKTPQKPRGFLLSPTKTFFFIEKTPHRSKRKKTCVPSAAKKRRPPFLLADKTSAELRPWGGDGHFRDRNHSLLSPPYHSNPSSQAQQSRLTRTAIPPHKDSSLASQGQPSHLIEPAGGGLDLVLH